MRLICPNCGAQYEVDDAVIPEQGRDVQCSNCGHTWYQQPAHIDAETAEDLQDHAPVEEEVAPEDIEEDVAPESRVLDPEVADILREEAARETAAREVEAEGIESQPDLGIEDTAQVAADRSAAARARMARLRGAEDADTDIDAAALASAVGSRKELLPDVEEIDSSLRAPEPNEPDAETMADIADDVGQEPRPGGRSFGFRLIVILLLLAALLYLFAPQIVQYVPALEPYMIQYVEFVNGLRDQIDPLVQQGIDWVRGLIDGGAE
ncbi:MJ0042 family finger-like domain protein [Candidatus Rhodobacter oscarellae]|uniref:MJ0042 family finger-like domain protein n=1 Tax=Candidatus Rhodobacter oscarellae TaxID=1675527 RepID=A0A0J9EB47_9RHOB|nr:zinc-ribbon domain-containing protein [Candidatus Rhodobacter lobularis]KMW60005.1 MJ0042 family finger-like domain protein [Candidatus Rhodobacter lobularis]